MKELKLTKKEMEILENEGKMIMESIGAGKTARDIMAEIYVKNLENKTEKQGLLMADAIIKSVKEFDDDYEEAKNNLDKYIDKFQSKVDNGKTLVESCNYWANFTNSISAAIANSEQEDGKTVVREFTEDEVTPELQNTLREKAKEAIINSGVMLTGIFTQADEFKEMADIDEAAKLLLDLGTSEIDYRSIVSMIAYTKVKSGEFKNIPIDITVEQISTIVCAGIEEAKIMEKVEKGNLAIDIATAILGVLGIIVLTKFMLVAVQLAVAVATSLFSSLFFLIPAAIISVLAIVSSYSKASEWWMEKSQKVIKTVTVATKAVINGITKVCAYVKNKVFPKIVETSKQFIKKVVSLFNRDKSDEITFDESIEFSNV